MSTAFDARSLEARYSFLDDCPAALLDEVITLPVGTLEQRVAGVRDWREALLAGRLPAPSAWPPEHLAAPLRSSLRDLGIARFCRGQPELVDALLADLLAGIARGAEALREEVSRRLRELECLERAASARREKGTRKGRVPTRLSRETRDRLLRSAEAEVYARERPSDPTILTHWSDRVRLWAEVAEVFGDLGEMLGRGWDFSLGVLRQTGWRDVVRLRELVRLLPQLQALVQLLGRLHQSEEGRPATAERVFAPVRRIEDELRETVTPGVPGDVRGIERSGDIARMLPSEALMLGHPRLRLLWHARRAERALLAYRVEGTHLERAPREVSATEAIDDPEPRRQERGPILVAVDTSGSMHGLPEQVAKAFALEAMRIAHVERRRCVLFAYSGPGQLIERELALDGDGLSQMLEFIGMSFHGGSDEQGLLERLLERIQEERWRRADVLLVSDGEWPVSGSLKEAAGRLTEAGCRFHGLMVGNSGRTGLHEICAEVHEFGDWASVAGWHKGG